MRPKLSMLDELDLVLIKVTNHLKCSYFGSRTTSSLPEHERVLNNEKKGSTNILISLLASRKDICFMKGFDGMQSSNLLPLIYFYIFILELCAASIIKTRKFLDNFHKRCVITVSGLL